MSNDAFGEGLLGEARRIWGSALAAADAGTLTASALVRRGSKLVVEDRRFDLGRYRRVFLCAFGKAAAAMAQGAMSVLGDRIAEGIVVGLPFISAGSEKLRFLPAAHPLPDERSVRAAEALLELARGAGADDLLIVLISGGGSAQAALPVPGVSLEEKRGLTDALLRAGAGIQELNAVRRGLSAFKGGKLARAAFPASVLGLILSDVVGNDLSVIASGPTVPDAAAPGEAKNVLMKYGLWEEASESVRRILEEGGAGRSGGRDPGFERVVNVIVGDNRAALAAAKKEAERLGFRVFVLTAADHGEAREATRRYAALLEILSVQRGNKRPLCLIAGGELTVTVRGPGRGGRNQEFVLASLVEMGRRFRSGGEWLIVSLGTDGIDGTTDAAGAWAGPEFAERAAALSLDAVAFLEANDSHGFFEKAGGLIVTGPTRTNVMDLRLLLYAPPKRLASRRGS